MLPNPFTPGRIANKPHEFFGRLQELAEVSRVLRQGSLAIDGPMGIGKSSLLSQIIMFVESNAENPLGTVYPMICSRSLKTPEDVASRLLAELTSPIETSKRKKFILPKVFEYESATVQKPADTAGSLRAICKLLTDAAREHERLIIVVLDEADKCSSIPADCPDAY